MKVKVSCLSGTALDWAVAECGDVDLTKDGYIEYVVDHLNSEFTKYSPSSDWAQAGPIIQRHRITVVHEYLSSGERWWAMVGSHWLVQYGDSPLEAAMRSYVVVTLGDTVKVPKRLVGG